MAWFRRNRDGARPAADEAAGAAAPEAAPEPGATQASPVPRADPATPAWITAAPMPSVIPTIQRSLGRIEARSATTLGKPSPLSLAPLGHAVTPEAPAGLVSAVALADDAHPSITDQPPLEYVQRAPAGAPPGRPAAPAQLLVPSFQPSRLPTVPVVPPTVQRAAAAPSFVTAPDPGPPLVLPVGEVLAPPPAAPAEPAQPAARPPAEAPLLAGPAPAAAEPRPGSSAHVQRAPAVELPLAPVPRHADHPGHVDGDETPAEAPEVQRAPVAPPVAPATPAAPPAATPAAGAPRAAEAPLLGAGAAASPLPAAAPAAPAEVDAPILPDLPLAAVQRQADHPDHPGHVDGDEGPDEQPPVQRAPSAVAPGAAPAPAAPVPPTTPPRPAESVAPLLGSSAPPAQGPPPAPAPAPEPPPAPDLPLPGPPVQRSAAARRPAGLGAPLPSVPAVPSVPPAPPTAEPGPVPPADPSPATTTERTAPLVGAEPLPPPASLPLAASQRSIADEEAGDDAPGADAPALDLVQRAPADGAPASAPAPAGAETPAPAVAPLLGDAPVVPTIAPGLAGAGTPGPAGATGPGATSLAEPDLALVQRAAHGAPGTTATTTGVASSSASSATPAAAPLPPLVVAPLLGGRPFSTQVQRAPTDTGTAPAGLVDRGSPEALSPEPGRVYQPLAGIGMWNGAPPPDLPGPAIEAPPGHVASAVQRATGADVSNVRIRRDTGPTAQRLAARAFTTGGEVHIPASVGSLDSGEGASLATHELVHAGQQAALGPDLPLEHTPAGQALEAHARSAEHASLAGTELPRLPLAPPAAPTVQRAPAEGGSASPFTPVQLSRLLDLADNGYPTPSVQRERTTVDEPVPPARPTTEAPPLPTDRENGTKQTPQEIEELAYKLFPTMRNLFRSELLAFRRRSGTSSDRPLI